MPRKLTFILVGRLARAAGIVGAQRRAGNANDTARFLAGLSPSAGSPLAALTNEPLWREHARYFNSIFGREERKAFEGPRIFSGPF